MNKSKILKSMNKKSVQVIAKNWIDNDELRENLKYQLSEQGMDFDKECTETEKSFSFTNGQFIMKENRPKELVDVLSLHSTFFKINGVRFEISSAECINERTIQTKNSIITLLD